MLIKFMLQEKKEQIIIKKMDQSSRKIEENNKTNRGKWRKI